MRWGTRVVDDAAPEVDAVKPVVTSLVSPISEDRYGTKFAVEGWELESYRKTGIVTLNHGWNGQEIGFIPIGRNEDFEKKKGVGLIGVTLFDVDAPAPSGPWARFALEMNQRKLMRGWSHMFDPLAWTELDGTEVKRALGTYWYDKVGRTYTAQEMMEYGPVFVPANPDAQTISTSRELRSQLEQAGRRGLEVPPLLLPTFDAYIEILERSLETPAPAKADADHNEDMGARVPDLSGAAWSFAARLAAHRIHARIRGGASRPQGG